VREDLLDDWRFQDRDLYRTDAHHRRNELS
jgi:hypothetical protein